MTRAQPQPDAAAALAALIAPWPGLVGGVRLIEAGDVDQLLPAEESFVDGTVAMRRAEFAAGRILLRRLMGTRQPIGRHPDRRPQLPDGWVGSLAHDTELAVAVVGPARAFASIGVDVEPTGAEFDADETTMILRPDDELDTTDPAIAAFVIKEAVFKAWSSSADGRLLNHHDVRVRAAGGIFEASVLVDGSTHGGTWSAAGGRWLALSVGERR